MPTYEYACDSCGAHFEVWQKMSDDALEVCPTCQGKIRRVLYPAGIVFKGGGFYKTDYSSSSSSTNGHSSSSAAEPAKSTDASAGTNGSNASSSATSAPKESKPAKKAE